VGKQTSICFTVAPNGQKDISLSAWKITEKITGSKEITDSAFTLSGSTKHSHTKPAHEYINNIHCFEKTMDILHYRAHHQNESIIKQITVYKSTKISHVVFAEQQ
jgi:hypothetical protein